MSIEFVSTFARQRNFSLQDATQMFLQVIVLKHISIPGAKLIGGGALVFGHGNPRFSEDVDLTGVSNPTLLKPGLAKAALEMERWLSKPVMIKPPKPNRATWVLSCQLNRAESLQLHVDSQPYKAHTQKPIVIEFPAMPSFICSSLDIDELMAEKILALTGRHYLSGRDLFDLWFHWLRLDNWKNRLPTISNFLKQKLVERKIDASPFYKRLALRLSPGASLDRAKLEWERYLPAAFNRKDVYLEIVACCHQLSEVFA